MPKPRKPGRKIRAVEGLSRRAYGRARGVSEGAIRGYIRSGLLRPAILADGSIDPARADEILAGGLTRGPGSPLELAAARRRKLRAECRLLNDELDALLAECIPREDLDEFLGKAALSMIPALRLLADAAPSLAGGEPVRIAASLSDLVYEILTAISTTPVTCDDAPPGDKADGHDLADLDAAELAALKTDLQARRLEIVRQIERGELVRFMPAVDEFGDRLSAFRASLLALPTKAAPQLCATPKAARAFVRELLVEAVGKLEGRGVRLDALLAALDDAIPLTMENDK